ncbi:hypothetical protein HPY31_16960 [Brevibacillus sp. HB1.3]|nr:hypothetical protein [Brevibacillus sp. HB1.3]
MNKDSDLPVPTPYKAPKGYIWHHHEDGTIMVLVEKVFIGSFLIED